MLYLFEHKMRCGKLYIIQSCTVKSSRFNLFIKYASAVNFAVSAINATIYTYISVYMFNIYVYVCVIDNSIDKDREPKCRDVNQILIRR